MSTQPQPPAIGRIVHAVVKNGHGTFVERPAIITRTWGQGSTAIQCTVFFDAWNDGDLITQGKSSLVYDARPTGPDATRLDGTQESWHWPGDRHVQSDGSLADEITPHSALTVTKDQIIHALYLISTENELQPTGEQNTKVATMLSELHLLISSDGQYPKPLTYPLI